jgi:hypothetical protein
MGLGLHSSYPTTYPTRLGESIHHSHPSEVGFELIMRNRLKTFYFQRQRHISPLSASIKIKTRMKQNISCSRFRIKQLQGTPIQSSFHCICPLESQPIHIFFIMKYSTTIFSLVALIALVPALVAADDGESNNDDWYGHPHRPPPPSPSPTQVLWGQCTFILSIAY